MKKAALSKNESAALKKYRPEILYYFSNFSIYRGNENAPTCTPGV